MKRKAAITKEKIEDEVITISKLVPIIQDLKEFILTTAKGTEHSIRTDLGGKIDKLGDRMTIVEAKLDATQHYMIKMEKRLDGKIDATRTALDSKIDAVHNKLDSKIDVVHNELDSKIDAVHNKLDNKIDAVYAALDSKIDTKCAALDNKIDVAHAALDSKMDTLSNKFDKAAHRLDDHEDRIILLETA